MAETPHKKLKLVDDFETASWRMEGWQKVDDTAVLHRRRVQISSDRSGLLIQVYDFNTFLMTTMMESRGPNSGEYAASTQTIPFSAIENQEALKDAHQALTELKGNPPHIDVVLGVSVSLDKNVTVRGPLRLKGNEP